MCLYRLAAHAGRMSRHGDCAAAKYAIKRLGLTEVYATTTDTQVDVVFVHGLHGNPQDTWSSTSSPAIWPATHLGPILQEEKARILVYGYDAQVASFIDGVSGDKIHNHGELVAELAANRRASKATEHPIIFVAHSFGGLVVKRALIYSSEISGMKTEHLRSIFVSTYGILFLGTPHKGLNASNWRSRLEAICQAALPKASINDNLQLINTLKSNNETLQNIERQFIQLSRSLRIFFSTKVNPQILEEDDGNSLSTRSLPLQIFKMLSVLLSRKIICKYASSRIAETLASTL